MTFASSLLRNPLESLVRAHRWRERFRHGFTVFLNGRVKAESDLNGQLKLEATGLTLALCPGDGL